MKASDSLFKIEYIYRFSDPSNPQKITQNLCASNPSERLERAVFSLVTRHFDRFA